MKLGDVLFTIYDKVLVGVWNGERNIEEFPSTDMEKVEKYKNELVTGIWIHNETTLVVYVEMRG